MQAQAYLILIWTSDGTLDDVLRFALQRMGHNCTKLTTDNEHHLLDAVPPANTLIFVIGPHIKPDDVRRVLHRYQQHCIIKALILTRNTRSTLEEDPHLLPAGYLRCPLPLELQCLTDAIRELVTDDAGV
ncbi:MAG: hypothetical protein HC893_14410 [Chloroflexaceae bacterium]|nr:hypothetical protein [Chloroflexaceae bacterium]NJL34818.1 hypothetical protein [Chloroflexaceae bacterium]NJO06877.1 hypothetical protein [Chloroflexaceae bacterium]